MSSLPGARPWGGKRAEIRLDKTAPVPLWRQLYASLRQHILQGKILPGDRLPSEIDLVSGTGASRATVRRALELLERERLIYRAGTKGTFASEQRMEQPLSLFQGLSEKFERLGLRVESRVLSAREGLPDEETQKALRLRAGDRVYVITRLRAVDGLPLAVQTAYMPTALYPRLAKQDLAASLTKLIRSEYGYDIGSYRGTLEVVSADDWHARHLKVPRESPLVHFDGVTYDLANAPIRRTVSVYRSDRLRFTVEGFDVDTKGSAPPRP